MAGAEGIIIGFVIAAVIAFVIVRVMMSQMKPVNRKHEASAYTTEGDVKLSVSEDVYLRTDVTRRKLESGQHPGGGSGGPGGRGSGSR